MNDPMSWDPALVKKFSSSNHLKMLNQLRNEVIKYPLNNKKKSKSIHLKDSNKDNKNNSNVDHSPNELFTEKANKVNDENRNKSNVSFNNSKNFSIYNQSTNNSRELENIIPDQSKSNDKSSSTSFKERLNEVDMK
ncbi:hypothetical protein [Prochlorococcus sp. MIT 1011]|uniref:hypothetical protein n=1 Tax=Prochlorococcus sp. MIT 1011 TaxID=3082520 RepID=UPI0039B6575C